VNAAGVHLVARDLALGYAGLARAARSAGPPGDGAARPVVENVDLSLAPGESVAVIGASGSGKTTLLHGLAGLLRPLRGEVILEGEMVASPAGPCTSRHAACMFQRDLLLPWLTAAENAAFAVTVARPRSGGPDRTAGDDGAPGDGRARLRAWARGQAEDLLTEFGLGDTIHAYPHQLSGGMRQRVAFARTLILGRGLVLLDEPFAGLDLLTRADLTEWLKGVMARHPASWVLVTHDVGEAAALAGRVAVLGGRPARITGWVETAGGRERAVAELQRMLATARALA
jgi:NitT/TauT family transport system ATP-binding protein